MLLKCLLNKKILLIPIIVIIGFIIFISNNDDEKKDNVIFHKTLANPEIYENGIFSDEFSLEPGRYSFGFVPNGDSPKLLSISIKGENFDFFEDFKLDGKLHQTAISEYYTWNYDGQKEFSISEYQKVSLKINPNGNTMGSVSVNIIEN